MNVWPVIVREVRVQARQSFTYNLRMLGVGAVLLSLLMGTMERLFLPGRGDTLFVYVHWTLLGAIWILVPLSASDCLSHERREGTLGLLMLTPLRAGDIVIAKGLAHGLRAFTLWLASLPVVVIPFLIGGLAWRSVIISCAINFASISLALGASVLASSLCSARHRSLALTMVLAAVVIPAYVLVLACGLAYLYSSSSGAGFSWSEFLGATSHGMSIERIFEAGFAVMFGAGGVWNEIFSWRVSPGLADSMITLGAVTVLPFLAAWLLLRLAARNVRRRWQDQSRSARVEKLERVFCTPMLWNALLKRWMRWKLNQNPIGWLEQRTWSGRLVMWSWLAVLVSFYSSMFTSSGSLMRGMQSVQAGLAFLLLISLAATAAGSFRRERESGVMELLLVSPLSCWQIIRGRVFGIWGQFAPAVVLLVAVWFFAATFIDGVRGWDGFWFSIGFLTLPVIGLYYSLAKTNFLTAFIWTLLMGYALPLLVANLDGLQRLIMLLLGFSPGAAQRGVGGIEGPVWATLQILLAVGFALSLHRNLEQRRFALERRPT